MAINNIKQFNYLILMFISLFLFTNNLYAQVKDELSRIDRILSETGKIIRYNDYYLPGIKGTYGMGKLEMKVRVVNTGSSQNNNFVVLSRETKYSKAIGSISEDELIEILDALATLSEIVVTETNTANYTENKYISKDGFQIGYYLNKKGKAQWFVTLEKYASGKTFFLKNSEDIKEGFLAAQNKLKEFQ